MKWDLVVVGAGIFGLTVAQQAAERWNLNVAVVERRGHVGGNCYSEKNPETGIEVHKYGAHIFHTTDEEVWSYVRRFTDFNDYIHHVWTNVGDQTYSMPVNLGTINQFFGAAMGPDEARELVEAQAGEVSPDELDTFEGKGVSRVGRPLFDAFYRDYTAKQWQTDPKDLPASVAARLPVRFDYNNRYFSDKYEGLPLDGYTAWFERMASDPRIEVFLETDFFDESQPLNRDKVGEVPIVYTGPLDKFFDYSEGRLGWRTVEFDEEILNTGDFQGTSVMNYGDPEPKWTRIIEFRHFHPERNHPTDKTVIYREYSKAVDEKDEPYYPVHTPQDRLRVAKYLEAAEDLPEVFFGGRLGTYSYMDMDKTVAAALKMVDEELAPVFGSSTGEDDSASESPGQ